MAWSGVITNAGAAMLNQLAAGEHVLHIDSAKVGSGTTAAENMRSATALNTQKDSASILSSRVQSGRVQIKVQVGPNASAGYTAHEIGVWAHVDSGASALFALHQDTGDGVAIPSAAESPDFAFALYIVFAAANTANIAVTVDTSATVTESTLAEAIEDALETYATVSDLSAAVEDLSATATSSAKGMMSAADKAKLDGIAAQANKYVHPADKTASAGVPTANQTPGFGATFNVDQVANDNNGHVTGHTTRTVKIPNAAATQSAAGLMSAADKTKLDGVAAGANAYVHPSYTARTGKPTANQTPAFGDTFTVSQIASDAQGHVTGATDRTVKIPNAAATQSAAGLMSAADKKNLDGIMSSTVVDLKQYRDTSKTSDLVGEMTKIGKVVFGYFEAVLSQAVTGVSVKLFTLPSGYRADSYQFFVSTAVVEGKDIGGITTRINSSGEFKAEFNGSSKPAASDMIAGNFIFFTA